jgi:hypothetical protein
VDVTSTREFIMFRSLLPVLLVLAAPLSAQALDCTGIPDLVCDGPALQGTIGLQPEADYMTCGDTFPHHYKLYSVTLASAQEITVSVTGSAASVMEVVVFGGCDENSCLAQSPTGALVLAPVCLEAGTYTVGLRYGVDAVFGYEILMQCVACEPVGAERQPWGTIKSTFR